MKLFSITMLIVLIVSQNTLADDDEDIFEDDEQEESELDGKQAAPQDPDVPHLPQKVRQSAGVETTTVDLDELWEEIWASGRDKSNWPKDEYGFSKQINVEKLRENDLKFLNDVYHHKYAANIHSYETKWEQDYRAARNDISQRLKYTYDVIHDPYVDARSTAQRLVDMYKKDFNRAYQGAQHRMMDYITPLVNWLKEDINATDPSKQSAKAKIETVAKIHSTLEKSVQQSKDGVTESVMKNLNNQKQLATKKSAIYDPKSRGNGNEKVVIKQDGNQVKKVHLDDEYDEESDQMIQIAAAPGDPAAAVDDD